MVQLYVTSISKLSFDTFEGFQAEDIAKEKGFSKAGKGDF